MSITCSCSLVRRPFLRLSQQHIIETHSLSQYSIQHYPLAPPLYGIEQFPVNLDLPAYRPLPNLFSRSLYKTSSAIAIKRHYCCY